MKAIRNITILFNILMLAALGALILWYHKTEPGLAPTVSYSDAELAVYKKTWDSIREEVFQNREMTLRLLTLFWGAVVLLGNLLIFLVYRFQVKPVREMESFAAEISKGNLDVALPIHRGNLFGNFTESFDRMRGALKASKERELAAEKAKQEMVAELSHDLKTPVATIRATCEVLDLKFRSEIEKCENDLTRLKSAASKVSNRADSTEAEDIASKGLYLETLRNKLEKVGFIYNKTDIINELVGGVFRATLDDMEEIKIEPVENPSSIIEGYFRGLKDYGNIILENHIPECLLYFDRIRMEQVIDNIVGNSYKYAGTDIHVSFAEIEGNYIKITIRDAGPGVPESELPLLTEKYHRGTNAAGKQGYGLGMYLVNHYMEHQGGGMEYYNDGGFVVELALKKV